MQDVFDIGNLSWLRSNKMPVGQHKDMAIAAAAAATSDAVVMVNGALVTVDSVLQKLHKSEDERAMIEKQLKNMEQECGVYSEFNRNNYWLKEPIL